MNLRGLGASLVLAALLLPGPAWPEDNPFRPGGAPVPRVVRTLPGASALVRWQRVLQGHMTALLDTPEPSAAATLCLASGIYGVVHALGPGHQKTLLAGLVLSGGVTVGQAAGAALLTATLHAGSAIVLIGGTALALERASLRVFEEGRGWIQRGAALALVVLALGMLVRRVREAAHRRRHLHEEGHHVSSCPLCARREEARRRGASFWGAVAAGGLVPCPGAALLLLLGVSAGRTDLGILGVLALSLGMGITLFAVELGALGLRRGLLAPGTPPSPGRELLRSVLEVGGALAVLVFAVLMAL